MISPELIRKIKNIHIKTGRIVDSVMAGQYHSAFKGAGIEFEEVREYVPGDEVKSIDWNVTARIGRPYIKRYREERELVIMVLVDMSASGLFGTGRLLKREAAAEMAAILAFNAIRNSDKVGAILFTGRVEKYIPPKKGSAHVWRVIKETLTHEPEGSDTDLGEALRFLGRVARKRCVAFLISDFIDQGFERELRIAGRRHDLIGVLMSDPGDYSLPAGGMVSMRDLETGQQRVMDASDRSAAKEYEHLMKLDYVKRLDLLKRTQVDAVEISTHGSPVKPLRRFFRYRESLR